MKNPDLWNRICACHPDEVEADFPFSRRLARDNGWSVAFANRVILEYLKFVYLSQLGAAMVTPSDEVDQAWHLHLTYTKHYWGTFKNALLKPLHHMPTRGGTNQAHTFKTAYDATLALYREEFGEPPADIWPASNIRFGKAPYFVRLNTQDVWIIRKPGFYGRLKAAAKTAIRLPRHIYGSIAALLAVIFGTGLAFAHGQPAGETLVEQLRNMVMHWALVHTLWFAVGVIALVALLAAFFQKANKNSGCGSSGCGADGGGGGSSGCGGCGD